MTAKYQDDFYDAVNGDWIKKAEIPADKPATGGFYDLADKIENLERGVLAQIEAGEKIVPALEQFVAMHRLTSDWAKRGADEAGQVKKFIEKIEAISSWEEFQEQEADLIKGGYDTPLSIHIEPDSKNTERNELWVSGPGIILPDVTTYQDKTQKEQLLGVWSKMTHDLLVRFGFAEAKAQDLVDKTLAFDQILADRESSREVLSDSWKNYHPMTTTELQERFADYDITKVFTELLGQDPKKVIVYDGDFYQKAAEVYNGQNFEQIKAWTIVQNVLGVSAYLSDETRVLAGTYSRTLSGAKEATDKAKAAFRQAHGFFAQTVGKWYGETYFGPEAKLDVTNMVHDLIGVYEGRFNSQKWLSEDTRQKAKIKLAALKVKVGYPDALPAYLQGRIVDPTKSVLENAQIFATEATADTLAQWGKKPDKSRWGMPGDLVNAYYSPDFNQIVFPAAILQAPFYDYHQTASENFGGIGTVIAHEITHAFDTNGARYDERGNLKEWWTKQDFANFEEKTQAVIDRFEGQDSAGAKINGHLTVSENVADLGGVSAALAAAKERSDFDPKAFFTNFATLWRQKAEPAFLKMLATVDVHAPAKLRTNVILPNFDDFQETYEVQEGDGMWVAPADRIQIW